MDGTNGNPYEPGRIFEFGSFVLDVDQGLLTLNGETVRLKPRTLRLLSYLVENANVVLDKPTLIRAVWDGAFVEEANIAVQVSNLRKLFAEDPKASVSIDTFPKRGYRFSGEIRLRTNAGSTTEAGSAAKDEVHSGTPYANNRSTFNLARLGIVVVVAAAAVLTVGFMLNSWRTNSGAGLNISRVAGTEGSVFFSVSPSGEYMAHNVFKDGKRGLFLTHLATRSTVQLVEPDNSIYLTITFTPNGSHIYYVKSRRGQPNALFRIPLLGGEPITILEKVDGRISFSPDGERFAFYRRDEINKTTALLTAKNDGTDEKALVTLDHPDHFSRVDVAWSPNGRTIVAGVYFRKENSSQHLMAVDVQTGEMRPVGTNEKWESWESFAWLPDGSSLVAAIRTAEMIHNQLFLIPFPNGDAVRLVPGDNSGYRTISVTADGKTILAENYTHQTEVWHTGMSGAEEPRRITKERHHFFRLIRWTSDGRIVFGSNRTGERNLWMMENDGTGAKQITSSSGQNEMPFPTADNKHIVFISNRLDPGVFNIWRSEFDGRNAVRLTDGTGEQFPVVTPDMKWVVYETTPIFTQPESSSIWKIPFEGGSPIQLVPAPSQQAAVSPDGTLVACTHKPTPDSKWRLALFSIEGGPSMRLFDLVEVSPVRWTPDGKALAIIRTGSDGVANLWAQPIDGTEAYQVTKFTSDGIPSWCDWSAQFGLICSRGRVTRDAVLITNFR